MAELVDAKASKAFHCYSGVGSNPITRNYYTSIYIELLYVILKFAKMAELVDAKASKAFINC